MMFTSKAATAIDADENDGSWEPLVLWSGKDKNGNAAKVEVPSVVAKILRPHQREGVSFCFECVSGMRESQCENFKGRGAILADDMGLGKTLQSITLMYTMLSERMPIDPVGDQEENVDRLEGVDENETPLDTSPMVQKAIVVCPTSLVKNWDNELDKWLGKEKNQQRQDQIINRKNRCVLNECDRAKAIKEIDYFLNTKSMRIMIISYETYRIHAERFEKKGPAACQLLICDEAHRLKNCATQTNQALNRLDCSRRILLSGTPMQNDLGEFYAMASFTNPKAFGTPIEFRKHFENPILHGREPGASDHEVERMEARTEELSAIVNQFVLRRTNTLLSKHLPPKVMQVVICKMTDMQKGIYNHLLESKAVKSALTGRKTDVLPLITALKKLCNHPRLVYDAMRSSKNPQAIGLDGCDKFFPPGFDRMSKIGCQPELSGKMWLLDRMLALMRPTGDRIVIVSNYTQTLDVVTQLCRERRYPVIRLDGSTGIGKRQKLVDQLCDMKRDEFVFLLSSKAGGCGLNLIGANRLILFDPDWNPANDKQAAARIWRDGQKKQCFVYRFLAQGTIEEKVYQRQLSKEALQDVVGSSKAGGAEGSSFGKDELRDLFKLREDISSTLHDKLKCERCDACQVEEGMADMALEEKKPGCDQIGAPQEVDLDEWAHHSVCETIPDNIMSQMGGADSPVSFAFTCSVEGKPVGT